MYHNLLQVNFIDLLMVSSPWWSLYLLLVTCHLYLVLHRNKMANNNMSYDLQAGDILFEGDVQIVNQIVNQSAQSALGASSVDGGGLEGQGGAQGLANVAVQMQQSGPGASSVDGVRLEAQGGAKVW